MPPNTHRHGHTRTHTQTHTHTYKHTHTHAHTQTHTHTHIHNTHRHRLTHSPTYLPPTGPGKYRNLIFKLNEHTNMKGETSGPTWHTGILSGVLFCRHFVKGIRNKLYKASKLKSCQNLKQWTESIVNMLWWSLATSGGNLKLIYFVFKKNYCLISFLSNIFFFIRLF